MSDDYFKNQYSNQKKGNIVFGNIQRGMVLNAIDEKKNYKWSGNLSPSALEWDMCMAKYIYEDAPKGWLGEIRLSSETNMSKGSAFHIMLQDEFIKLKKYVKRAKPKYPKSDIFKKKIQKYKPKCEAYIWLDWCRLSGWIDLPTWIKDKLAIGDIKTTNGPKDKWYEDQKALPKIKQLTQVYSYVVGCDELNLFGKEVDSIYFIFHNNHCEGTEIDPVYEWHQPVRADLKQLTIDLLKEGKLQLERKAAGEPQVCSWRWCRRCTDTDIKTEFNLNWTIEAASQ